MHSNKAFRAPSRDSNIDFARSRGFGILTVSDQEDILASHVPFLLNKEGTKAEAHLAKNNPILGLLAREGRATLVVSGPDIVMNY